MSNKQFTPAAKDPWKFHEQGEADEFCLVTEGGKWVIAFRLNGELSLAREREICRRIVASVNAADGIDIEALETIGADLFDGDTSTLIEQRGILLDALKKLTAAVRRGDFLLPLHEADSAIKQAEGGA